MRTIASPAGGATAPEITDEQSAVIQRLGHTAQCLRLTEAVDENDSYRVNVFEYADPNTGQARYAVHMDDGNYCEVDDYDTAFAAEEAYEQHVRDADVDYWDYSDVTGVKVGAPGDED